MRKIIWLLPALALSGCATTSKIVNCENASRVRAAAVLAIQAVDRACPLTLTQSF